MAKKKNTETPSEEERRGARPEEGTKEEKKTEEKPKRAKKEKKERKPLSPDALVHQLLPIVFVALAALLGVCIYTKGDMGIAGNLVSAASRGLFGCGAYLIPVWLLLSAILWRKDVRARKAGRRQIFGLVLILVSSVLW